MNTLNMNTEFHATEAGFETILQENRKILLEKIDKLKLSKDIKEKINESINQYSRILEDKYIQELENLNILKQYNKDLIFLDSIRKILVDKLIFCCNEDVKYKEIEKNLSKIEEKKLLITNQIKEILSKQPYKKVGNLLTSLVKDTESIDFL